MKVRTLGVALAVAVGLVSMLSACPALAEQRTSSPAPRPSQPQKPASAVRPATPAEADAIAAVVQQYFAALNARDLETALGLWKEDPREGPTRRQMLQTMLARSNPTWSEVAVTRVTIEAGRARARVGFAVAYRFEVAGGTPPPPATSGPAPSDARPGIAMRSVIELVSDAGGWRLLSEKPETQDIAERLLFARDEAGLARVLAEDRERVTLAVGRVLMGLAGAAAARQQHDEAIRAYTLSLRFAENPPTPHPTADIDNHVVDAHIARALAGLAQIYAYQPKPDWPQAIALLTRAVAIDERIGDEAALTDELQALGNAFYGAGNYAEALDRYQRVLPLAIEQQDRGTAARTQLGIGNVQYLFGQYDLSLAAYRDALVRYTDLGGAIEQAHALLGLGRVYAATGDYVRAREHDTRALTIFEAQQQKGEQAGVLLELGRVAFLQGQIAEARTFDDRALAIYEATGDAFGQARSHFSLGLLHIVEGQFDQGIDRYTRAIDAFDRVPHPDGAGQALIARASARLEHRDLPQALEDFTASLRRFEKGRNREGIARAHLGLAMTYVLRREAKAAIESLARANELADRVGASDIQWQARHEAGRAWLLAGDEAKARQSFEASIRLLESTRGESGGDAEGQAPTTRAGPYVALVEWHAAHGDAAQALIAADAAKRRVIEDLLTPFAYRLARGLTMEQQARERQIASRRVSLARQLRRERDRASPDATRLAALERDLTAARTAADDWTKTLARDHPAAVYERGSAAFTSLDTLAAALPTNTALVHFVVGDERTTVIVATPPRVPESPTETSAGSDAPSPAIAPLDVFAFSVAVTRAQLAEQVWRFNDGIAHGAESVATDAVALFDLLLRPIADRLAGRSQLVFVPDDSLWTLPFEALMPAADRYLIQDTAITMIPSCAAWLSRPPDASTAASTATSTNAPTTAPTNRFPLRALDATGEISDISPLQTLLTFAPDDALGATPLAAWELIDRQIAADVLVLPGVMPKPERLRLDMGRLGAAGLWWALQSAGAPRVVLARRAPIADASPSENAPAPAALLPHPQRWATWLVVGPPEP